jgi:hypothetical protein
MSITDYDRSKQWESAEYFNCLDDMITNGAKCICKITSRLAMSKATFSKNKYLYTRKLD